MEAYGIRIFVDDIRIARRFYGSTLGFREEWAMPELGAVGFDAGGIKLIVEEENPRGEDAHLIGRFIGISFAVDDMETAYRDMFNKGVHFAGPPQAQAWGGTLSWPGTRRQAPSTPKTRPW